MNFKVGIHDNLRDDHCDKKAPRMRRLTVNNHHVKNNLVDIYRLPK